LSELVADGDALVQPYLSAVESSGERALVWIDGRVTHAVQKSPRFSGGSEAASNAVEVADDERELARAALASFLDAVLGERPVERPRERPRERRRERRRERPRELPASELLYARIDLVRRGDGRPVLMELELIEPSLFLAQHPPALERFADALAARLA
jgi:hypothetical protein